MDGNRVHFLGIYLNQLLFVVLEVPQTKGVVLRAGEDQRLAEGHIETW
jgi:hypothetical protein